MFLGRKVGNKNELASVSCNHWMWVIPKSDSGTQLVSPENNLIFFSSKIITNLRIILERIAEKITLSFPLIRISWEAIRRCSFQESINIGILTIFWDQRFSHKTIRPSSSQAFFTCVVWKDCIITPSRKNFGPSCSSSGCLSVFSKHLVGRNRKASIKSCSSRNYEHYKFKCFSCNFYKFLGRAKK